MSRAEDPTGEPTESTEKVVLHSPNPLDLTVADLNGLANKLSKTFIEFDQRNLPVTVESYDPLGAGNHFIDMLYVILPKAEFVKDTIFATLIASLTSFMRERFKSKHKSKRPRRVYFFDPDGRLLGVFELENEDTEIQWLDASDDG